MEGDSKIAEAAFPFGIDRNLGTPLADQVADGLRQCILSGRFRPGDVLPSLHDLVKALGVSQRVARDGVQRVVAEGLAVVRPRSGCRVLAPTEDAVRGRVLAVFSAKQRVSYYYSVLTTELERIMREARYGFESVYVPIRPNGSRDMSEVSNKLRSPFDLMMSLFAPEKVERLLLKSGVPYLPIGSPRNSAYAALNLRRNGAAADAAFAARCVELGVRTAWLATYTECRSRRELGRALESAGIAVEWQRIPPWQDFSYLERLERSGFEDAAARFSNGGPLPDVAVVMDDYYLRGVLSAFASLGLRMPDDIRLAGVVNEGFRPCSSVPLACFVVDARRDAASIAAAVMAHLEGRAMPEACYRTLDFRDGPSLSAPGQQGRY